MFHSIRFPLIAAAALVGIAASSNARAEEYDRTIRLVNHSSATISEFHASNVGTNSWEEDILGDEQVRPGQSVRVNLDDGTGYCRFDFKTVMSDGTAVVRRNVDVCTVGVYTIND